MAIPSVERRGLGVGLESLLVAVVEELQTIQEPAASSPLKVARTTLRKPSKRVGPRIVGRLVQLPRLAFRCWPSSRRMKGPTVVLA